MRNNSTSTDSDTLSVTSTMEKEHKNDLGLVQSIPERDVESGPAQDTYGAPLKETRTANSRDFRPMLSKTLSRVRTSDTLDPGPPPDGGFVAWRCV